MTRRRAGPQRRRTRGRTVVGVGDHRARSASTSSEPIDHGAVGPRHRRGGSRWRAASRSKASSGSTPGAVAWFDAAACVAVMRRSLDDRARPSATGRSGRGRALEAVEHRRRADDLADGDDAGAADAREADREAVGVDDRRRRRAASSGIGRPSARLSASRRGGASPSTVTVANDGQSPSQAREVEVAARLVDRRLAPERRVDRLHREAVHLSPQSPQPSQMRSLITTRKPGRAISPRLRSRRFSAAQPDRGSAPSCRRYGRAGCACASSSRGRGPTPRTPSGNVGVAVQRSGSSVVTITRATPSASRSACDVGDVDGRRRRPGRRSSRPCRCRAACR